MDFDRGVIAIGAALAIGLVAIPIGIAIGMIVGKSFGVHPVKTDLKSGWQIFKPESKTIEQIRGTMILGAGLAEAVAVYGFIIALILIFFTGLNQAISSASSATVTAPLGSLLPLAAAIPVKYPNTSSLVVSIVIGLSIFYLLLPWYLGSWKKWVVNEPKLDYKVINLFGLTVLWPLGFIGCPILLCWIGIYSYLRTLGAIG